MVGSEEDQQARIDALKIMVPEADLALQDRMIEFADRGIDKPESLSMNEISQISYALRLIYRRRR